ncbi:LA_2168 family protein [Leptospira santarosai]
MRKFIIYSYFIIFLPISASEKSKGWTQISWMGWGLAGSRKDSDLLSQEKEGRTYKELRINSSLIRGEIDESLETSGVNIRLQADLTASSESKLAFFAGKNLFFEFKKENLSLVVGRIQEELKRSAFTDWTDGTDGIVIKANFKELGRVRFDLFDFYSGYSLFEKNGLRNTILNTKNARFDPTNEIEVSNIFKNRYRGGVSYRYDLPYLETGFRFQYLNLQNWGRYANDSVSETGNVSSGDRDYLTHSAIELKLKYSRFHCFFSGILARGQDKTGWNRIRKASAIPITGEAILISTGVTWNFWKFDIFGFLPDRDKRSENGEVLELGFIGIGSSPSPVFSTNQSLDFYPSAWITDRGLEKQSGIQSGKRQSAWTGINLEYQESLIRFRLYIASYFFLSDTKGNEGALTISKSGFRKDYLRETLIETLVYFPSENTKFDFLYLKASLGGSWSDSESGRKELFFQIVSGVVL